MEEERKLKETMMKRCYDYYKERSIDTRTANRCEKGSCFGGYFFDFADDLTNNNVNQYQEFG